MMMLLLLLVMVVLVMISIVLLLMVMVMMITNFCDIERIVVRRLIWSICWRVSICSRK